MSFRPKLPSDEVLTIIFQHVSNAMTSAAVFVVGAIAYKKPSPLISDEAAVAGMLIMALGAALALLNIVWSLRRLREYFKTRFLVTLFALAQILFMGRLFYLAIVTRFV